MASSLSGRVRRHAGTNTPLLSFRARCAGARMLPRKTPSRTADATRTAPDTQTTSAETPRRASSPTSCSTRNRPRRLVTRHRPLPRRLVALSSLHPQAQICLQPLPWGESFFIFFFTFTFTFFFIFFIYPAIPISCTRTDISINTDDFDTKCTDHQQGQCEHRDSHHYTIAYLNFIVIIIFFFFIFFYIFICRATIPSPPERDGFTFAFLTCF